MTTVPIPELSLVVLVGVTGSGKSTFARAHFSPWEVIAADFCRGLVADDPDDQAATKDAFDVLAFIAGKRLAAGRLTVVDATSLRPDTRRPLIELAREHDVLPVAIVLDVPEKLCVSRNGDRFGDAETTARIVRRQRDQLRRDLKGLQREGFRHVHVLRGADEIAGATVIRTRLYHDLRHETGPFDVIGDVHGCLTELAVLLRDKLGYQVEADTAWHPEGRKAVFVGDLADRGPDTPGVLRLVMGMVAAGTALCVQGNHEAKLLRALRGRNVKVTHGLAESLAQLAAQPESFRAQVIDFLDGLVSHYVLDGGRLVVAHAGLIERYQGRTSRRVREFCLYGQTTGETDEYGLPVRLPWAEEYRGKAMVLYGHTPVPSAQWLNNTMCLDTGCVFGGKLTALRYPEREVVQVPAVRMHYKPARPFPAGAGAAGPGAAGAGAAGAGAAGAGAAGAGAAGAAERGDLLDIADVLGTRVVETAYLPRITVPAERAAAALEVMSRFAIDPRTLIYLPPTMAPVATAPDGGELERPETAFTTYRAEGVGAVVCEEKHMGSRAVLLICQPEAHGRFAVTEGGAVWTRTGRPFFVASLTAQLTRQVRAAAERAGLFKELDTSWLLLDAEIMPWNAKAGELLRDQYAAVGAAARASLSAAVEALSALAARGIDGAAGELLDRTRRRAGNAAAFIAAYRRYCWTADDLTAIHVAPFTVLASEGAAHHGRPRSWHLDLADRLCAADPALFTVTRRCYVDVADPASVTAGVSWWTDLTGAGGEGMVVKPAAGLAYRTDGRGLVQPGLKVRGREYLRVIYGPDYTDAGNIERLRQRAVGHKRSLALREHALGLEALDRLARGEPAWRLHECVFAVLALESEPVDPRL